MPGNAGLAHSKKKKKIVSWKFPEVCVCVMGQDLDLGPSCLDHLPRARVQASSG